jgi:2-polyprenyl-3-methyl-5-hydroxy-6-metoxy-1,4-benzoquinol methylase
MSVTTENTVLCNLCQVDDATEVFGPGIAQANRIVRCNRCGLMYASPRAREVDHVEIESWTHDDNWNMAAERPQRFEKERLQVRDYRNTRALLSRLYPNRGKILELGSSMGFLLKSFQDEGWEVLGVDPNRYACRYASERLGVPSIPATLEDAGIPDASIDVVLMMHVIEHVPDPVQTLREIHRILKPGGHLVLETPRYDTLMFKLLGHRERSISCAGHIYFFTNDSLRKTCQRAGFQVVQHDCVGRSLTLDRLMYNLGVVSKSRFLQAKLQAASRRLGFHRVSFSLNLRDMQRLCVQKVPTQA